MRVKMTPAGQLSLRTQSLSSHALSLHPLPEAALLSVHLDAAEFTNRANDE